MAKAKPYSPGVELILERETTNTSFPTSEPCYDIFQRFQGGGLAHPGLFSLPSNDVVPGQREAAIQCVLDDLVRFGLPLDLFSDFGIE